MKLAKTIAGILLPAAVVLSVTGCSEEPAAPTVDANAPVTITVSNLPSTEHPTERAAFLKLLDDFHTAYPNITANGVETAWDPQTFQALLAGKQLPTVFLVPFTEPQGMIARNQLADISWELEQVGLSDKLNPAAMAVGQKENRTYGVPVDAYAIGLVYNRDLFVKAGLDPDKPPTTWAEVRTAAKTIADETGVAGYAQMTTKGTGGWMLAAMTYSAGGTIEDAEGTKATFTDGAATKEQLELLKSMRWTDNSMGSNFLYDQAALLQTFAAGQVGMILGAPISYQYATTFFKMSKDHIGVGPMPQGTTPGGTMTGGALHVVNPDATPEQRLAAVKLIEFRLRYYTDESRAVEYAQSQQAAGLPVGLPGLPTLGEAAQEQYLNWIQPYVNVPLANFKAYTETVNTIKLAPEPAKKAQEVYVALDPVVQAVLTDENADIDALLSTAAENVDALLRR